MVFKEYETCASEGAKAALCHTACAAVLSAWCYSVCNHALQRRANRENHWKTSHRDRSSSTGRAASVSGILLECYQGHEKKNTTATTLQFRGGSTSSLSLSLFCSYSLCFYLSVYCKDILCMVLWRFISISIPPFWKGNPLLYDFTQNV